MTSTDSSNWQVLEEDSPSPSARTTRTVDQYAWGQAYVDELLLRDRHTGNGSGGTYGYPNKHPLESAGCNAIRLDHNNCRKVASLKNASHSRTHPCIQKCNRRGTEDAGESPRRKWTAFLGVCLGALGDSAVAFVFGRTKKRRDEENATRRRITHNRI